MMANIFILSEPIQTGKTTLLMNWIDQQQHVGGILTPDVNGKRKLYDIAAKQYHDLQLDNEAEGLKIGRFTFSETIFAHARTILSQSIDKQYEWVIVDEIGRLEMDRKEGLEPAISELIHHYKTYETTGNLLLVIRDYLLNDALKYYGIEEATVLPRAYFQTTKSAQQSLKGLVLCGGQSVRMGRDKAFIEYHGKPQCYHVYEMLQTICDDIFISCNSMQKENIDKPYQSIEDNATFTNAGPMTGLLSAFHEYLGSSFLVLGCDYPNFTQQDMMALYNARTDEHDVVCYLNPESNFEEPLLAVYEKNCAPLLLEYYQKGNTSLRHFLKTVNTKYILPANIDSIKSIDKPEDDK